MLRGENLNSSAKILLMSHFDSQLRTDDQAFDSATILYKPIKPVELQNTLESIIAGDAKQAIRTSSTTNNLQLLAHRHPRSVLLVEDNIVNQKVALRMLEKLGYDVDLTQNGLEAIEAVQQKAYDIVFMDVQMPQMNGLDATRNIRQLDLATQPSIIAMSASAMVEDHVTALEAGMNDFVDKPISVDELRRVLMKDAPKAAENANASADALSLK